MGSVFRIVTGKSDEENTTAHLYYCAL